MRRALLYGFAFCALFLHTVACKKEKVVAPAVEPRSSIPGSGSESPPSQTSDICALLTKHKIEAIQGSPIQKAASSVRVNGGLRAERFYTAQDYSKSVILWTTQNDIGPQKPRRNLKELWTKTFHRDSDKKAEEAAEEEREGPAPKEIEGLGEEAYWSGGSLYIFTKNAFIRIAIGGPEPEEIKLQRLRTLAEKVILRF